MELGSFLNIRCAISWIVLQVRVYLNAVRSSSTWASHCSTDTLRGCIVYNEVEGLGYCALIGWLNSVGFYGLHSAPWSIHPSYPPPYSWLTWQPDTWMALSQTPQGHNWQAGALSKQGPHLVLIELLVPEQTHAQTHGHTHSMAQRKNCFQPSRPQGSTSDLFFWWFV